MKTFILVAFWAVILGAVVIWTATGFDGSRMDIHGWIALGLGSALSLIVGIGLMALMFYSHRHGYDDRVPRDTDEEG